MPALPGAPAESVCIVSCETEGPVAVTRKGFCAGRKATGAGIACTAGGADALVPLEKLIAEAEVLLRDP